MIASVLVPTWNSPDTLGPAVRSALRQTVTDLEVLIIGDGVVSETREVIMTLLAEDPRVRFLDLPKAPGRGEANRDVGVREAASDAIVYLADDDLLMPRHVGNLIDGLATAPFVQSRNGYVDADDTLRLYPTDLADPRWPAWHLREPPRNRVSLTGTAHSRAFYLSLPSGWEIPDEGVPADLHLWRTFFRQPGFRGLTHPEFTTLQFPAYLRRMVSDEAFAAGFLRWEAFTREPGAHERLQEMVRAAAARSLIELSAKVTDLQLVESARVVQVKRLEAELRGARAATDEAWVRATELEQVVEGYRASRSWRLTAPLRALRRLVVSRWPRR